MPSPFPPEAAHTPSYDGLASSSTSVLLTPLPALTPHTHTYTHTRRRPCPPSAPAGPRMAQARAAGAGSSQDAQLHERNLRAQLTHWGTSPSGDSEIHDYANKMWAGLVGGYYRWGDGLQGCDSYTWVMMGRAARVAGVRWRGACRAGGGVLGGGSDGVAGRQRSMALLPCLAKLLTSVDYTKQSFLCILPVSPLLSLPPPPEPAMAQASSAAQHAAPACLLQGAVAAVAVPAGARAGGGEAL